MGSEIQVNTYTTGSQVGTAVAKSADGFVVVWHDQSDGLDGDGYAVRGQRFNLDGTMAGGEFQVNSYTTGYQLGADVTMAPDGGFVVVWFGDGSGYEYAIHGRRFASDGSALGDDFLVNTPGRIPAALPRVASDDDGDFVVIWQEGYSVLGQLFDSGGSADGASFQANVVNLIDFSPAVDMNASGEFVVAWQSLVAEEPGAYQITARRYASDGSVVGGQFAVSATDEYQYQPDVGIDANGNFAVVWQDYDGYDSNISARRVNSDGTLAGTQFQVDVGGGYTAYPAVDMSPEGHFLVSWDDFGNDDDVFAQRYLSDGSALAGSFLVNTYTAYPDGFFRLGVAMDSTGEFMVTWRSESADEEGVVVPKPSLDGDGASVRAAIYNFCTGASAPDDDDGDGYFNFCDICPGFDDAADIDSDGIPDGCDDHTAPQVTTISSTPDTGDAELAECEEARVLLTELQVTFNETMATPDVESTEAYRVIAPGTDASIDTTSCAALGAGDEMIPVSSVSYDAGTNTATLEVPLQDGLQYRLLVCDSLTDEASNALAADFSRDFRIEVENLFSNGHFDCDVGGWTKTPPRRPISAMTPEMLQAPTSPVRRC